MRKTRCGKLSIHKGFDKVKCIQTVNTEIHLKVIFPLGDVKIILLLNQGQIEKPKPVLMKADVLER